MAKRLRSKVYGYMNAISDLKRTNLCVIYDKQCKQVKTGQCFKTVWVSVSTHIGMYDVIGASMSEPHTSKSNGGFFYIYMWQSCVEIVSNSVAYFDRIVAFEELYH